MSCKIHHLTIAPFIVALFLACVGFIDPEDVHSDTSADHQESSQKTDLEELPKMDENRWKAIDTLIAEDKFEAAAREIDSIRQAARTEQDDVTLARALITEVQLRIALHGYATAVDFLGREEWPTDPRLRTAVELYYARALVTYQRSYSWEISQREQTGPNDGDLEELTAAQISARISDAFANTWNRRDSWGNESLGSLAPFFIQNEYPARIRGTLRDAVTYLWAEDLADSSRWTPNQSNGLHRLDLSLLLSKRSDEFDFGDHSLHPLERLAAALTDLESWHRANDQPEAAFEARRQLIDILGTSLSLESDHQALRASLDEHLELLGDHYEWWSFGMATRAAMEQRRIDTKDHAFLVSARAIARRGAQRHPDSIGGQRCRQIADAIEAPTFDLTAMETDAPGRRSIQVSHRNLGNLHFRAYHLDLEEKVLRGRDHNLLPAHQEISKIVESDSPLASWSSELAPTPDFRSHDTYITPPLERPGLWILVASIRKDFAKTDNQLAAVNLIISDLVLESRQTGNQLEVTARSGATGRGFDQARIGLYRYDWRKGHRLISSKTSASDGRVRFSLGNRYAHFLLASDASGAQLAIDRGHIYAQHRSEPEPFTDSLIYTDRSIYRPGQEILWKVVAYERSGTETKFHTAPEQEVTVELRDANSQTVESLQVTTNQFGSVSGRFEIPAGRLLGNWYLKTSVGGGSWIKVEEYKRPTFEVELDQPSDTLRLNQLAKLGGTARYYFGLPVSAGTVDWQVQREPVYPRWWFWTRGFPQPGQTEVVAAGESVLDENGQFELEFVPDADERLDRQVTYRYRLSVDVTAEAGETRSASRSYRLGFVAIDATITPEKNFFDADTPVRFDILRRDLDGVGRSGLGQWSISELSRPDATLMPAEQPLEANPSSSHHTPGDLLRPRWDNSWSTQGALRSWPSRPGFVVQGHLEHRNDGQDSVEIESLEPGAYRLKYTTEDSFGSAFESSIEFLVVRPGMKNLELPAVLIVQESSGEVGSTARVLVHSGLDKQSLVLETSLPDHRQPERRVVDSSRGLQVLEFEIENFHRGGLGLTLSTLRDHQFIQLHQRLSVPWTDRKLDLSFSTFRDRIEPGSTERWKVTVSDSDGAAPEPESAELLAYMYDRSLELFTPHSPPDVLALFPDRVAFSNPRTTLGSSGETWHEGHGLTVNARLSPLAGDRLKMLDGYGIGGLRFRKSMVRRMAPMAMAASPSPSEVVEEMVVTSQADTTETKTELNLSIKTTEPEPEPQPVSIRSDFSETGFWHPHLILEPDGSTSIEVEVPDSVTEWSVWVHGLTKDFRGGSLQATTQSTKELMVRPYLPRFLREGDRATIRVAVDNAGDEPLEGVVELELFDPETLRPLAADFELDLEEQPFSVDPGRTATLDFSLVTPSRLGQVAVQATARTAARSDGEVRSIPVLPSRVRLMQSRFATLHDEDRRTLHFEQLASDADPTRIDEQLVVTLDGQLLYSVLDALPYLVNYPYECTEQTLNRFVSTAIVSTVFEDHPMVAELSAKLAERETPLESWTLDDPNRKMALEETPWLQSAEGGDSNLELIRLLDPDVARAQRDRSLAKLANAQTSLGAFPWWPGGPPSPYMTLYILQGLAKAIEFDVVVPREMIVRAWQYLHRHYLDVLVSDAIEQECCWEMVTFLNYVLSSYPDESWTGSLFSADERQRMLDFSVAHRSQHSPLLKAQLALTLERSGRHQEASTLVEGIMDSARSDPDRGVFWQPEDRSWLWYNDSVEGHSMVLRTLAEIAPDDPRRHGLVQWLLLDKKLNHWKSTRATAEAIYSLVHYLEREGTLAAREEIEVEVGSLQRSFVFEPDEYSGKGRQLRLSGEEITPAAAEITVAKETPGFLFASATWHFSTEELPPASSSDFFSVERDYFRRIRQGNEWVLEPLESGQQVEIGDQLEVRLSVRLDHAAEFVHLKDPRGAGFEPETLTSGHRWNLGVSWYEEIRDSGANFFFDWLPAGEYTFKYRVRANMAGNFRLGPATIQSLYAPEFTAYSSGAVLEVESDDSEAAADSAEFSR